MRRLEMRLGQLRDVPVWRVIAATVVAIVTGVLAIAAAKGVLGEVLGLMAVVGVWLLIIVGLAALAYANRVRRGW
jgi:hypothetical protein